FKMVTIIIQNTGISPGFSPVINYPPLEVTIKYFQFLPFLYFQFLFGFESKYHSFLERFIPHSTVFF
ncbi:hypothetical protein, partial [Methanosarcina sp. A14]|uniref:hypothetical protein n=1 Tax=Methanosarcina sp. A14 TaxID=1860098 RepID=UPI001C401541